MTDTATSAYDPARVVADLRALDAHTGGPEGSRRLAWTPEWLAARAMLRESLATLPVEVDTDAAGNLWAVLRGARPEMLVVGSHLDSVPKGGWLDGALGVMSGLELLRALAAEGTPPVTVALVDWADEEGARFSRSLFGSAAAVGTLDIDILRGLTDSDGNELPEVLAEHGVEHRRPRRGAHPDGRRQGLRRGAHRAGSGAGGQGPRASARSPGRRASSASG